MSEDGKNALTIIAFIGSVFSPYYALARRRGATDPLDHCALNVALYGKRVSRWSMTERGRDSIARTPDRISIGPSSLEWDGACLTVCIEEISVPIPRRLRGRVRVYPEAITGEAIFLDEAGKHRWRPIAPRARIEVEMSQPALSWKGSAYLDSNDGGEPLESAFRSWHWSRADLGDESVVLYDAERRDGSARSVAIKIGGDGRIEHFAPPPPRARLPRSLWRVERSTRADTGDAAIIESFEDTPFYARSLIESRILGQRSRAVHESLSLDRFRNPLVQMMLPFRMPRRGCA